MLGRLLVSTKKEIEKERVRRGIFTLSPSLSLTDVSTTHSPIQMCICTHTYTNSHIYANKHTHTHTHTCTRSLSFFLSPHFSFFLSPLVSHSLSFSLSSPFSSNPTNSRLFCFNCETRIAFVFHFDAMNEKREKERDHSSTFWETRDAFIAKMPPKEPNLKSLEQLWLWLLLGSRRSCSVVVEHTTGDEMVLGLNTTRVFFSSSFFFTRFP